MKIKKVYGAQKVRKMWKALQQHTSLWVKVKIHLKAHKYETSRSFHAKNRNIWRILIRRAKQEVLKEFWFARYEHCSCFKDDYYDCRSYSEQYFRQNMEQCLILSRDASLYHFSTFQAPFNILEIAMKFLNTLVKYQLLHSTFLDEFCNPCYFWHVTVCCKICLSAVPQRIIVNWLW